MARPSRLVMVSSSDPTPEIKITGPMAATFLELNGVEFTAAEESVVEKTLALAAGELKEAGYAAWLKTNSR